MGEEHVDPPAACVAKQHEVGHGVVFAAHRGRVTKAPTFERLEQPWVSLLASVHDEVDVLRRARLTVRVARAPAHDGDLELGLLDGVDGLAQELRDISHV